MELELGDVAPAAGTQLSLFTPQTGRTGRLGWQLARLGLRFGEERVGWMEIEDPEAPLAEARWSWRRPGPGSPATATAGGHGPVRPGRRGRRRHDPAAARASLDRCRA
jgi:hypothetical protein